MSCMYYFYYSLNFLFSLSSSWFSKFIELIWTAVQHSWRDAHRWLRQATGQCWVWEKAFWCLEMSSADPSGLRHRWSTHPAPLYLVAFWTSLRRRNLLHLMNIARLAPPPLPSGQGVVSHRPDLLRQTHNNVYWIFLTIKLWLMRHNLCRTTYIIILFCDTVLSRNIVDRGAIQN